MFDIRLLFQKNNNRYQSKIGFLNNKNKQKLLLFKENQPIFQLTSFNKLIPFLTTVSTGLYKGFPIVIDLSKTVFADKLTYILLECLCYSELNNNPKRKISVLINQKTEIVTNGLTVSPLQILRSSTTKERNAFFIKKFIKDYSPGHYRKVIFQKDVSDDKPIVSSLMQDIESFLKFQVISPEYISAVSEVISELVDNALEHTSADCLVDIDITPKTFKKLLNEDEKIYSDDNFFGVNVVILNFSESLIGEKLKEKITNIDLHLLDEKDRYLYVSNALNNQRQKFSQDYFEDDFFAIASYQHKISSRKNTKLGGTGLTTLLNSLEQKSDAYHCYMISGNRVLWFNHDYLNYNEDGWIGFNKNNDFFNDKPDSNCFEKTSFFFPGTAYNLNFIVKQENHNGGKANG